jgi:hypothetical protein
MTIAIHPFERANLGTAPFRCTGSYESKYQACQGAPIQPGSSCDYCGQGIMTVFTIKSADGKTFKVGCDCVARTYRECATTDLARDARKVLDAVNKLKTAALNARKDAQIAEAAAKLTARAIDLDVLVTIGGRQRNAFDHLRWMFANGGRAGKLRAAKRMDAILSGIERYRAAVNDDTIRHELDGSYSKIELADFLGEVDP